MLLAPQTVARLLLRALGGPGSGNGPRALGGRTKIHDAADAHEAKFEVALRYAFAMAHRAVGPVTTRGHAERAALRAPMVLHKALRDVLPGVLLKTVVAGGRAGMALLPTMRVAGGPGSGNFGHAGRPGEVGGSADGGDQRDQFASGDFYHGTSVEIAAKIKSEGLKPLSDHRGPKAFAADNPEEALDYAIHVTRENPDAELALVVISSAAKFTRLKMSNYVESSETIPPSLIKSVQVYRAKDFSGKWTAPGKKEWPKPFRTLAAGDVFLVLILPTMLLTATVRDLHGDHDQKSHGNWSTGGAERPVLALTDRMRKNADAWQKKTGHTTEAMTSRVSAIYSRATAEDKQAGARWYPEAHAEAERLAQTYDISPEQAAGVIAALSPLREWTANVEDASDVLQQVVSGTASPDVQKLLSANVEKAVEIAKGAAPEDVLWRSEGYKVRSFYTNIRHPESSEVTVDTHMLRVLLDDNSLSSKEYGTYAANAGRYAAFRQAIVNAAARAHVSPSTMQATTWVTQKRENPSRSKIGKRLKAASGIEDRLLALLLEAVGVLFPEDRMKTLGGAGSGNFDHAGRPGEVGGSAAGGGTSSPAFKAWFGNSKVVDEAGKPRVMYHGSYAAPLAFTEEGSGRNGQELGRGIYTTNSPAYAEKFGHAIVPLYVKAENIVNANDIPDQLLGEDAREWAIAHGYDAIRSPKGDFGDGIRAFQLVVFSPTQVKSAMLDALGVLFPEDRLRSAEFNPDQPRDDQGQWTSDGGGTRNEHGLLATTGQRIEEDSGWNRSSSGERPYEGEEVATGDAYVLPASTHPRVRDDGSWGSSHGRSAAITGASAAQMQIPGYKNFDPSGSKIANAFLNTIADDMQGSEEVLHHSFENVRGIDFHPGDTLRLPLTAAAGKAESYGIRLDADAQRGQPTVFVFDKGTQMAAYSKWNKANAKEFGHVYSEAIVAGGFEVLSVREAYMGSQHFNKFYAKPENKGKTIQIYGKVIRLKQTETFHPGKGWSPRG